MAKFVTNASSAIWWSNLQQIQVVSSSVKFGTNASCAIWWPNLELLQVEPPLAGEITQVLDAIPWVRCASGNVLQVDSPCSCGHFEMRLTYVGLLVPKL